jgi:hypothetical protein
MIFLQVQVLAIPISHFQRALQKSKKSSMLLVALYKSKTGAYCKY